MEEVTEAMNNVNISDSHKKNRIQVSNTKKPLFFYVNLAKVYAAAQRGRGLGPWNGVDINAGIGYLESLDHRISCFIKISIATVVMVAEILKNNGLAVEKKIMTSTVDIKDDFRGRPVQKAKIEIVLEKTANFDELMAAAAEEREIADGEEQS